MVLDSLMIYNLLNDYCSDTILVAKRKTFNEDFEKNKPFKYYI